MFKSASPPTLRALAVRLVGTAAAFLIVWIAFGGTVRVVLAFLAINFLGLGMQALELPTGGRPDQAAIPHLLRSAIQRRRDSG